MWERKTRQPQSAESAGASAGLCASVRAGTAPAMQRALGNQTLQRFRAESADQRPTPAGPSMRSSAAESFVHRYAGQGDPLPEITRAELEPRLGRDFRDVRVHHGAQADAAARSVDALAFTVGRDVVFRTGQYAPHSRAGRRLLAHELTHVMQQTDNPHADGPGPIQLFPVSGKGGIAGGGVGAALGAALGFLAGGPLGALIGGAVGLVVGGLVGFVIGKLIERHRLRTILYGGLSQTDQAAEEQALEQIASGGLTFTAATGTAAGVRAVQRMLLALGYPTGRQPVHNQAGQVIGVSGTFSPDGNYGPGSEAGMRLFQTEWNAAHPQADQPLRQDGACDNNTLAALMAEAEARAAGMSFREFGAEEEILGRSRGMNVGEIDTDYGRFIQDTASDYRIPDDVVAAIIIVETRGWVRHRLEYHVYQRFLNVRNNGGVYNAGGHAYTQNELRNMTLGQIRILSTSWGLGQVMGFNLYQAGIGFDEIQNVADYATQIDMIGRFLQANNLLGAARNRNWNAIAATYNGPANVGVYAPNLQAASTAWRNR